MNLRRNTPLFRLLNLSMNRVLAAGLCLLAGMVSWPSPVHGSEVRFPLRGSYIYTADHQDIGREDFFTVESAGTFAIRSVTELDLASHILRQSSTLSVNREGQLLSVTLHGDSGGKPFGLIASVVGASLVLEDTVRGVSSVVDYPQPLFWISGNFMQHLLHALSFCDIQGAFPQQLMTQAGPLALELLGDTWLDTGDRLIAVRHVLATLDSETIEVYVDDQGQVPILLLPDQGVRIHSVEAASWVPLADTGRTKKRE